MRTVVGIHACREVVKVRPKQIREVIVLTGFEKDKELQEFADFAKTHKIRMTVRPEGFLAKISASHQGIALQVDGAPELDLEQFSEEQGDVQTKTVLIALDEITDPHNLGAVLRTAWLMGAAGVLVPQHRAAQLTPATSKVASGGAEHVPLIAVNNLGNALRDLKDKGFWIYGLSGDAKQSLLKTNFPDRVVIVTGAEDKGIRPSIKSVCDVLIGIPQVDARASYNASVATAIVTFEVHRQHNLGQP